MQLEHILGAWALICLINFFLCRFAVNPESFLDNFEYNMGRSVVSIFGPFTLPILLVKIGIKAMNNAPLDRKPIPRIDCSSYSQRSHNNLPIHLPTISFPDEKSSEEVVYQKS